MGPIFYVGSKGSPLIDMGRATILSAENAVCRYLAALKRKGTLCPRISDWLKTCGASFRSRSDEPKNSSARRTNYSGSNRMCKQPGAATLDG